ncbi:MAG: cyclase family protein [Gemmatimonadaceae bacterium]
MARIYDVSIPVRDGGVCYPGNPEIRITPQQAISTGAGANVSAISFGSHTGTHVDAVKHFIDDGETVDDIPLEKMFGSAVLIEFAGEVRSVTATMLGRHDLRGHRRVLIKTRNSALQARPEFVPDYTYLAPDGAAYLVDLGVQLVGVDYLSVEQFHSGHHKTHRTLLGAGVVIVEGLALLEPPPGLYQFICLPLRLAGLDGAPARAVLIGD